MLVYVPKSRLSSDHSVANHLNNSDTLKKLEFINEICEKAISYLEDCQLDNLGQLLDETWKYKKSLANTTCPLIDEIYQETKTLDVLEASCLVPVVVDLCWLGAKKEKEIGTKLTKEKNIFSMNSKLISKDLSSFIFKIVVSLHKIFLKLF